MNRANCPLAGSVNVTAGSTELPFIPKTSTLTVTGVANGFARATPDSIMSVAPPEISEYMRKTLPVGAAETPPSVTVIPFFLNEKTADTAGVIASLEVSWTEPTRVDEEELPVTKRTDERPWIVYLKLLSVTPLRDRFRTGAAWPVSPGPKNCRYPLTGMS